MIKIFCDGGASPTNPGHGGIGFVVFRENKVLMEGSQYLGDNITNNEAEFAALINALCYTKQYFKPKEVNVYVDSELVYGSLLPVTNPKHKTIRSSNLKPYYKVLLDVVEFFEDVKIEKIPRKENGFADALSKRAMETKRTKITQLGE